MTLCAVNALILCTMYTTETLIIIDLSFDESCVATGVCMGHAVMHVYNIVIIILLLIIKINYTCPELNGDITCTSVM